MSVGKHILIVAVFASVAVGQTLFGLGAHAGALGGGIWGLVAANAVAMTGLAYLNLDVLAPRLLLKERYLEYSALLAGGVLLYIALKWMAERWMLAAVGVERVFNFVTVLDWLSNLAMFAIFLASGSALLLFRQWVADIQKIGELQNPVEEFKSRICAPALYRVLDYAAEKVKTDPDRVSEIIFSLSERLRHDLYEGKR